MSQSTTAIDFPEKGFVDEYQFYMKQRPSVVLAIEREVVDPLLIRNTEQDRAETQVINDVTRAQSNPEKFTTKERLSGLHLLRELDDGNQELVHDDYAYNEPPGLQEAINMDTLTYGITGTGDEDYGMKSRLFAGYTYTTGEYDIMDAEIRNKAHESGTMNYEDDGEMEHSQGLYEQVRVQPGNSFVHFLSIEAGTPAILAYALHNVLNTHGYGARETRSGKTIENHVRAVVLADHPVLLSVGEFLSKHDPGTTTSSDVGNALGNYLSAQRRENWAVYGDDDVSETEAFPEWFNTLKAVAGRHRPDATEVLREMFAEDTSSAKENIPEV
jgi:CRISPR-associated protein Csc2